MEIEEEEMNDPLKPRLTLIQCALEQLSEFAGPQGK